MDCPPFFVWPNHIDTDAGAEGTPWTWAAKPETVELVTKVPKTGRNSYLAALKEGWCVYSPVRSTSGLSRSSNGNPPAGVRGFVCDYDVTLIHEHLEKLLHKMPPKLQPQWVEMSLSGNFRLVWTFAEEVAVADGAYLSLFWEALAARIKPAELHPGLDKASFKPDMVWSHGGGAWAPWMPTPLSREFLTEVAWEAGKKYARREAPCDVPMPKIAGEVMKRWPNRWHGEFAAGMTGVRFWDDNADNPGGCMVKPDGLLCFTGPVGWMSWADLLGKEWVDQAREDSLQEALEGVYFDGRSYWSDHATVWRSVSREDLILELQDRGFDPRTPKGQTISPAGKMLNLIQKSRRIDIAMPLVNYRPGVQKVRGQEVLNTSRIKALTPAEGTAVPERDFPWLWHFLQNHFAPHPDGKNPLDHFLAWLQRAYVGLHEFRPLMGQATFVCGPKANGKTLLGLRVISPLLGNNFADPYPWLRGQTSFNAELFHSYLWVLNDVDSPKDGERHTLLSRVKDLVVNPSHHYNVKFGAQGQMDWTGRLFATLNDDPASVGLLPEVNSNTQDKLMFFRSQPYPGEWPANVVVEATLKKELPFFARWLLDWSAPKAVKEGSRVGVVSYFDPSIDEHSRQQTSAYSFAELLDTWIACSWEEEQLERKGNPTTLMGELNNCVAIQAMAREWKITQIAKALTTLARSSDSRVRLLPGPERIFVIHRHIPT